MKISLFGLTFTTEDASAVLDEARSVVSDRPRQIVTANVDHVVTLSEHARFREAYGAAAVRTLDGMPLVWLSRLRGASRARRVTGHDLLDAALQPHRAAQERVFIVCATDAAGEAMASKLRAAGAAAEQISYLSPPRGFESDAVFGAELANRIRSHRTTLLMMGVGAPKSEIWVDRQGGALGNPVVLNIGEALNVSACLVARAPAIMQRLGLEWLFRFATQPRRLFRRYFVRSWRFLYLAIADVNLHGARTG